MSYIPPTRRTRGGVCESNVNSFTNNSNNSNNTIKTKAPSIQEPVNVDSVENFPSLGIHSNNTEESTMNFASSLFIPQPKKEVIKDIPDGWVEISKKNGRTEFSFGDKSEYQYEMEDFVDYMEELRRVIVLEKMIDRYEEYEEIDLFIHGEKHIYGWEVDDYLKDLELERKLKAMENMTSDDESSDDDGTYEFN